MSTRFDYDKLILERSDKSNIVMFLETHDWYTETVTMTGGRYASAIQSLSLTDLKRYARFKRWEDFHDSLFESHWRLSTTTEEICSRYRCSISWNLSQKIDFYVSHSWIDDGSLKCMLLKTFADNFRKQNGRYPNLWLDRSCIDINDSMCKGFVYISVYMMLCDKLLIFISRTWLTRIWCILEHITFGAFCHSIEDRVNVILVDKI